MQGFVEGSLHQSTRKSEVMFMLWLMASEDLYNHLRENWDAENEYAETLRSRRNTYSTGLVVVAGLSAFQLEPLVSNDDVFAVPQDWIRLTLWAIFVVALLIFGVGAVLLFSSGKPTDEEKAHIEAYSNRFPDRPVLRRASDLWTLTEEEAAAIEASNARLEVHQVSPEPNPQTEGSTSSLPEHGEVDGPSNKTSESVNDLNKGEKDSDVAWTIRSEKMRLGLGFLRAGNRRISNRIKQAGLCIAVGYGLLVIAVLVYTLALNLGGNHGHGSPGKAENSVATPRSERCACGTMRPESSEGSRSDASAGRNWSQDGRKTVKKKTQ